MYTTNKQQDGTITIDATEPVRRIAVIYDCGPDMQELAGTMADALNLGVSGMLLSGTWVYRRIELQWEVGFYDPLGKWHKDTAYLESEKAAARVHYLNGGQDLESE